MANSGNNPLKKQGSVSSLEQSLSMISAPQQAPVTIYPGPSRGMANLSKADLEIAQRLQQLRHHEKENLPTEDEMASRLAQLKGLPADHYTRSSAAAACYQRPDTRTQSQQNDDLLSQVMQEVALDARAPKPEDEIEARLAKLRGGEPQQACQRLGDRPGGALGGAALSGAYSVPPNAHINPHLGEELDAEDSGEVESLMREADAAACSAEKSLAELHEDPEVAQAIAQAVRERDKKPTKKKSRHHKGTKRHETSEEEKFSRSDDSDFDVSVNKALDANTEREEIQRIVNMYSKAAEEKRKRKKKKKAAAAARGEKYDSDLSDLSSTDSELTSGSEKFSNSEELSD